MITQHNMFRLPFKVNAKDLFNLAKNLTTVIRIIFFCKDD